MIESNISLAHKEFDGNIIMVSHFAGPFSYTTDRSVYRIATNVYRTSTELLNPSCFEFELRCRTPPSRVRELRTNRTSLSGMESTKCQQTDLKWK